MNLRCSFAQIAQEGIVCCSPVGADDAIETLGDEARCARSDVNVFADQVRIDAGDKIFRVHIQIFHFGVQFGRKVVAQPFRVHAYVQIAQGRNAGATRLRHFFAGYGHKAVCIHIVRRFVTGELQHRGPEQRMEVGDVFSDKVYLFGAGVRHECIEITAGFAEIIFQ